jgi:acyl dehydratase
MPALSGLYARALGGSLPLVGRAVGRAPDRPGEPPSLRVEGVRVDPRHLRAYRQVCGFGPGDRLPATYPQTAAFPLILALLTEPAFPFATMGTVHIGNRIAYDRRLDASVVLDYEVAAGSPTPHPRGRAVVVEIVASAGGERVWSAAMELLRREPATSTPAAAPERPTDLPEAAPTGPARWQLASDLGRRYAAVSGDRNPIHLADLSAKPFGFSHHIAHGMWTHARALAELDNRLPDAYSVEVAFKKPLRLPGTAFFGARIQVDCIDFGLSSPSSDPSDSPAVHLLGRARPISS